MPLNEVIYDFFDAFKSKTRGYGSLDYEFVRYEPSKAGKAGYSCSTKELVDAFSMIVHESKAYAQRKIRLRQAEGDHPDASVRGADSGGHRTEGHCQRDGASAYRKDVIAKCYGGDISRKRKLLEKQKEGKKRMRQFGNVEVPQEAFTAVLKYDDNK